MKSVVRTSRRKRLSKRGRGKQLLPMKKVKSLLRRRKRSRLKRENSQIAHVEDQIALDVRTNNKVAAEDRPGFRAREKVEMAAEEKQHVHVPEKDLVDSTLDLIYSKRCLWGSNSHKCSPTDLPGFEIWN